MKIMKRVNRSEAICDECGLPITLCNARHFVHLARQRGHSKAEILAAISGELDANQEPLVEMTGSVKTAS